MAVMDGTGAMNRAPTGGYHQIIPNPPTPKRLKFSTKLFFPTFFKKINIRVALLLRSLYLSD